MKEEKMTSAVLQLQQFVEKRDIVGLRDYFARGNIVDIAGPFAQLPVQDELFIFKTLPHADAAELFTYLSADDQQKLITELTGPQIKTMLDNIYSDDVADFIQELPANMARKVLKAATKEQREEINLLLSYKDGTAGSIMTTDYLELKSNVTVGTAIEQVKKRSEEAETVQTCYVIDSSRHLVGQIDLYDLVFEKRKTPVSDVMDQSVKAIKTSEDQEEVMRLFQEYDASVMPVVNDDDCLIGIITIDDIMDVMEEETTEDIHSMAAVTPLEDSYIDSSVKAIVKSRLPWLLILLLSATFTGTIITNYESALAALPALSTFIPMLMDTSGDAGSQASTMVIRSIAVDGLKPADFFKVLGKEISVSFMAGIGLMALNIVRIMIFNPDYGLEVALTMSFTLLCTVLMASILGGTLPLLAVTLKLDPASVVSPMITAIVDALSLIVYFEIAVQLVGL